MGVLIVLEIVDQVAGTDETILLTGETGTGKDFLSRLIHDRSGRRDNLFVKTNCPGLTSSLFESELFGHAKGAFTGADRQRLGRFELDELMGTPIGQKLVRNALRSGLRVVLAQSAMQGYVRRGWRGYLIHQAVGGDGGGPQDLGG